MNLSTHNSQVYEGDHYQPIKGRYNNVCVQSGSARSKSAHAGKENGPGESDREYNGVVYVDVCVLHIKLVCPPVYISHNQCLCRCLTERRALSVVTNYETDIQIANTAT